MKMGGVHSDVFGAGAVKDLHNTIREFNQETEKQTEEMKLLNRRMLQYTVAITAMTFVMLVIGVVQVWLSLSAK